MATVYQPKDKARLYIRYQAGAVWKSKATPFVAGQEQAALAMAVALEQQYPTQGKSLTVKEWSAAWLDERSGLVRDYKNDRQRINKYVLPVVGDMHLRDVKALHVLQVIESLKKADKAPRTIRNVYSVLKAMWRDAVIKGVVESDPCIMTKRQLGGVEDKELGWRQGAVFTLEEFKLLTTSDKLPIMRRTIYACLGYGMLRAGELCGLRWGQVDLTIKPLGRLTILASHKGSTKTGKERYMPIHKDLARYLTAWQDTQWFAHYERKPADSDLVFQKVNKEAAKTYGIMLTNKWLWKHLDRDLETLGLRHRRVHDFRRTGISLTREAGARADILARGTHSTPKTIMELYTSVEWKMLCDEVSKLGTDKIMQSLPPHLR